MSKRPTPQSRTPAKRRQRAHNVLPAGFDWRDGRPRWLPSPTRRRQGWRPFDLARHDRGHKVWMTQGEAVDRCKAINAAVQAWTLRGVPPPADMADLAPAGSITGKAVSPADAVSRRSIGALVDAWFASSRFVTPRAQGGLSPNTIRDHRTKLGAFLIGVAESEDPDKVAAVRALDIDTLAAPEREGEDNVCQEAYDWLLANNGHAMAFGALTSASAFFTWCWKKKRIRSMAANPVELVERTRPEGRIRVGTQDEMAALLASADDLGFPSVADAVLLALDLGWSLADLLRLDWRRIGRGVDPETGVEGWVIKRVERAKTGVVSSDIPLMAMGDHAIRRIVARNAAAAVTPTNVLVREASPRNRSGVWNARGFNDAWRLVRDHAAQTAPNLLTGDGDPEGAFAGPFDFMDTRDTFITLAREAELTVEQVCNRSLHKSGERVLAVWRRAYGATTPRVAAAGARKMGLHMVSTGWVKALGVAV